MAYLNVRERRLETKIAYVGALQSGKGTNFDRLGGGRFTDDVLALYWQPKTEVSFRDCNVRVELVTSRGDSSRERVRALLRDADGIVFVADADPLAQERNRVLLGYVREALTADGGRTLPVVVQVNKADLPDAVAAADIVDDLEIAEWPHVTAAALRGEGVVETAERALEEVLENLRRRELAPGASAKPDTVGPPPSAGVAEAASAPAMPREGNPLLAALRQVLRETVASHVEELERRTHGKLDQTLALQQALASKLDRLVDEVSLHRRDLLSVRETIAASSAALAALGATTEKMAMASVRQSKVQAETATAVSELTRQVGDLKDSGIALDLALQTSAAELTKNLEAQARAEREHQQLLALTKRAVEAVAVEVRSSDPKSAFAGLKADFEKVTTSLEPTVAALGKVAPRLAEMEATMTRNVRESVGGLAKRIEAGHAATTQSYSEVGAKTAELQALLETLIEELKKPKKGWFS